MTYNFIYCIPLLALYNILRPCGMMCDVLVLCRTFA